FSKATCSAAITTDRRDRSCKSVDSTVYLTGGSSSLMVERELIGPSCSGLMPAANQADDDPDNNLCNRWHLPSAATVSIIAPSPVPAIPERPDSSAGDRTSGSSRARRE